MKTIVALLIAGLATLSAKRADACTAPRCLESWAAPDTGKSVPANAPAIVFVQGTTPAGETPVLGAPSLKNGSGPIASTRVDDLLKPSLALPLGDVTLEWDEGCVLSPSDAGVAKKQLSFVVVAASPLPTALGTATLTYARGTVDVTTSSGSCTDKLDAAKASFSFTLDPALEKFRAVARFVTTVDGKTWGTTAWGREGPSGKPADYGADLGVHRPDLIFTGCGPSPIGVTDRGVEVGKHSVEIRAEVAGAPAIPPAKFEIDLHCDGDLPDGGSVSPDGAIADTSTVDASAEDSAAVSEDAAAAPPAAESSSSCATGRSTTTPSLALVILALVFARRARPKAPSA